MSQQNNKLYPLVQFIDKYNNKLIYISIIISFSVLLLFAIKRHLSYHSTSCDLLLFDQVTRNTLKGNIGYSYIKHSNFFSEHIAFIFIPISLFYLVFNRPEMLLIIQSFFLSLTILPLYWISKEILENSLVSLFVPVLYILSPYLWDANIFDFHQETLVPCFFLFSYYYLLKKQFIRYLVFISLALICKEDMSIYSFGLGLYILLFNREPKSRIIGVITILLSIIWFYLCMFIFIPYFSNKSVYYTIFDKYGYLGKNLLEIIRTVIFNPYLILTKIINHIFNREIILSVTKLFYSVLFLPLISFHHILITLFPILINILSSNLSQYNFRFHYSMSVLPFLFISSIYGLKNIMNFVNLRTSSYVKYFIPSIIISVFSLHNWYLNTFPVLKSEIFIKKEYHKLIDNIIKNLPTNSVISAQTTIAPHLFRNRKVYCFPDILDAEYIFLDYNGFKFPLDEKEYFKKVNELLSDDKYKVIYQNNGIILLKKKYQK